MSFTPVFREDIFVEVTLHEAAAAHALPSWYRRRGGRIPKDGKEIHTVWLPEAEVDEWLESKKLHSVDVVDFSDVQGWGYRLEGEGDDEGSESFWFVLPTEEDAVRFAWDEDPKEMYLHTGDIHTYLSARVLSDYHYTGDVNLAHGGMIIKLGDPIEENIFKDGVVYFDIVLEDENLREVAKRWRVGDLARAALIAEQRMLEEMDELLAKYSLHTTLSDEGHDPYGALITKFPVEDGRDVMNLIRMVQENSGGDDDVIYSRDTPYMEARGFTFFPKGVNGPRYTFGGTNLKQGEFFPVPEGRKEGDIVELMESVGDEDEVVVGYHWADAVEFVSWGEATGEPGFVLSHRNISMPDPREARGRERIDELLKYAGFPWGDQEWEDLTGEEQGLVLAEAAVGYGYTDQEAWRHFLWPSEAEELEENEELEDVLAGGEIEDAREALNAETDREAEWAMIELALEILG